MDKFRELKAAASALKNMSDRKEKGLRTSPLQINAAAAKMRGMLTADAVLELLAERDADKKRIAELEGQLQSGFTPEALAQEERAENAEQRVAELEARLVVEIEPPPVIYPGRYDCHAMHSAIRRAGFRVAGDSEHVGDVDMRDERALTAVSDKQRIAELEAKLATPVRLLGEMLLHDWEHRVERQAAFEHRKIAWDARLAEDKKAILAAGFTFTVEGDE